MELGKGAYQQPLTHPHGHFVLEVVGLPAELGIGRGALLLQPFCAAVEDLEDGAARGLEGVGSPRALGRCE